ncbi:single-stranded DNA-binding protein [candidate division KSB1 bacterium]|nr:single-stranded DNA-binding protein [candidate division KSB1 bacterium]
MASSKGTVNKVILIGRLGADPEVQYTPSGAAMAKLSIATNRAWKDEQGNAIEKTDWHRVIAWRKTAEIAGEYLKKGTQVYVEGRLESRSWDDQSGQKKFITEVIVENLVFLSRKDERTGMGTGVAYPPMPEAPPADIPSGDAQDLGHEEDLPF